MHNHWFFLDNNGKFNGNNFSFLTSNNDCSIKYFVLEEKFRIAARLQWFSYAWRRRENENIEYLYSDCETWVNVDEILNYAVFKAIKGEKISKAKEIEKFVEDNIEIKKALIEKYISQLGRRIYTNDEIPIHTLCERYCGLNVLKDFENFKELRNSFCYGDNISEIDDIRKCIINAY